MRTGDGLDARAVVPPVDHCAHSPALSSAAARLLRRALSSLGHRGLVLPVTGASIISTLSLLCIGRVSLSLALVTFLLVYASYMVDHAWEIDRFAPALASARSRALAAMTRPLARAAAAAAAALGITAWASGPVTALALFVFPAAVALYGTPLIAWLTGGRSRCARIKDIPYIKAFYTAFFWGLLLIFGGLYLGALSASVLACALALSSQVLINTVYCDIKDIQRDLVDGVWTLPSRFGKGPTLRALHVLNAASVVLILQLVASGLLPGWMASIAVVNACFAPLLAAMRRRDADVELLSVAADAAFWLWFPAARLGIEIMNTAQ